MVAFCCGSVCADSKRRVYRCAAEYEWCLERRKCQVKGSSSSRLYSGCLTTSPADIRPFSVDDSLAIVSAVVGAHITPSLYLH